MTQLHKTEPIFVGRRDELKRFGEILASPKGQAVLVVGPQGMGKTLLVDRMARIARAHPDLKCGTVRYEVTKTDDVAGTMALMIDHAFEAAKVGKKFLSGTDDQWRALFKAIGVVPVVGKAAETIGELALSLKRDPAKDTRTQFIERLRLVSEKMPDAGRAIFVIDPEKYMKDDSHDAWRLVLRDLPDRIIFLFAQRPEDVLAKSAEFGALSNVTRIPDGPLDVLDEHEVDDLVQAWAAEIPSRARKEAASALARYNGHPYAVAAALSLLSDGAMIADLPGDPTPTGVAEAQWRRLCDEHKENAVKLFEAYAILEVAVPDDVVETISGVDGSARKSLVANAFVAGLLRTEPDGTRIYHSLLADHICDRVSESDGKAYHTRAIDEYRRRLTADVKPDALAAVRLPEHVLVVEGPRAFVDSFVNECTTPLFNLGLLDAALAISHRALEHHVSPGSAEEAMISGNVGVIYQMRGDLDEAEKLQRKALKINEKLGQLEGTINQYGNLGLIFKTRGDLDEAEKMLRKSLEIGTKLGRLEGMASDYGNLGHIYATRGDLYEAEKMQRRALEINEKLGRLEGIARSFGGLGNVFQTRGDLDAAEKMYRKGLEIDEKLGRLQGMASRYGNLGLIFQTRGDLDEAEKMQRKALEIDEQLGQLAGMAGDYGNLGLIFETRGNLHEAEKMQRKALEINEKLGRLEGMARAYGGLGNIFQRRGDQDAAEKMYRKGLEIDEKLGLHQGMASKYGNLGLIFQTRGDLDEAEKMYRKALGINEELGRHEGIANQYGNLGVVFESRGDLDEARKLWTKARDLFAKIGMPQMVEKIQGGLDDLPDEDGDRS